MKRNYQVIETFAKDGKSFSHKQSYADLDDIKDFVPKSANCWKRNGYSYSAKVIYKPTKEIVWEF